MPYRIVSTFVTFWLAGLVVGLQTDNPVFAQLDPQVSSQTSERPNILLILADDLGFSDLGCYGGEIATPNLDLIAERGVRSSQFYNTARCWPTRGSLMTGYYAQQIRRDAVAGIPSGGGNRGQRPAWAKLLPDYLRTAGYRSYHAGKWHIDGMPVEGGFDRSYYLKDQGRFFNPTKHWLDDVPLPEIPKGTDFYATTHLADRTIEFLLQHQRNHAGKPFFQYLAFAAPHFPLHAKPEDIAIYDGKYDVGWEAIRRQRWGRIQKMGLLDSATVAAPSLVESDLGPPYHFPDALQKLGDGEVNRPVVWESLTDKQKQFQADKMELHAAMIHRMDIEIGRVFDQIKSMGQWENTLVIFLSDNGASAEIMVRDDGHDPNATPGSAETYLCLGPGWSTTCNTPFRRHKTWTHEGGIATPLIFSWPKVIRRGGQIQRDVGHVIDIAPTLMSIAGLDHDQVVDDAAPKMPGLDRTQPPVSDESGSGRTFWWFHDGHKAIRDGDWKAVAAKDGPWELYDLGSDRGESIDLATDKPERLASLKTLWQSRMDQYAADASRDLDPKTGKPPRLSVKPKRYPQAVGQAKRRQVLPDGETFMVNGHFAFLLHPQQTKANSNDVDANGRPWVFYAPALAGTPDRHEQWMHTNLLRAGVAVAGVDVGETYGSPNVFPTFGALREEMIRRGYSPKPAFFGRSRGGLWTSSWAIEHPNQISGLGCIYPVFDFTTYPGIERAAPAYGLTPTELTSRAKDFNPIERAEALAKARVPVYIIHGIDDKVVPIRPNSESLVEVYRKAGASDLITLKRVPDQWHNYWPGFFQHQPLVDFLIERAKVGAAESQ